MRKHTGLFLILLGLVLAVATAVLVMRTVNQATEASRGGLAQASVVVANRSILDRTTITSDAVLLKSFPADFAPPGALGSVDQAVGKIARGFIATGQVLVADQVATSLPSPNLSARVPPGKVAIWLPMPPLLASAQVLKPGDHVDILLTLTLTGRSSDPNAASGPSTQATLQNVEVFRLGEEEVGLDAPGPGLPTVPPPTGAQAPAAGSRQDAAQAKPAITVIGFLVDHQDALIIKFIKDSGGTIDLVLRSSDDQRIVRTDSITTDNLVERFRFRVPQPITP